LLQINYRTVKTFLTQTGHDPEIAAHHLEAGELVAIPTETVYGLAGNALLPAVVARIFAVKNRPAFDPLIVHIAGTDAVERYATEFPAAARALAGHFWPGPLTLLLPKHPDIPNLVTAGLPRVALRMPAHPLTAALLRSLPFPLAAPSANPFGYISPTTARHVADQLQGQIPFILDGGPCQVGVESTIIGFEDDRPVVYRLGGLALEEIEAVAGPVAEHLNLSGNPAAPGLLKSHYAPRKPLLLNDLEKNIGRNAGKKIGVLTYRRRSGLPEDVLQLTLSEDGDPAEAAQHLFDFLRILDASDVDLILAETGPESGLGRAINDRLRRAAAR
jgi:L-threonylcarbamoyladenylate synthase